MTRAADLVRIYLHDHDAAAAGGLALARRCASANQDNDLGAYLTRRFIPELETDHQLVEDVLAAMDAHPSTVKRVAVRAGELVGRAKLNGALVSYSPLSRVVELEALIAGVHAKQRLWVAIEALADAGTHQVPDVSGARERAESQLADLESHHRQAIATAFMPDAAAKD